MTVSLLSLLLEETKQAIYDKGIAVAQGLGLPTTAWAEGDPTRSLYWVLAETLEPLEVIVANYIKSGFLTYASGDWLRLLAYEVYKITAVEATYATSTVVLTNTSGNTYVLAAGDVVLKNTTGKTFTNTSGGTMTGVGTAGASLSITVVADESGSASSTAANNINSLVTTLLGVTVTSSTTAVGTDAESDDSVRTKCRAAPGAWSPNGPGDAYHTAATDPAKTGTTGITKTYVTSDSANGTVTVYLAGPSGTISGADLTKGTDAITAWATPLCITPTVLSASSAAVAITYTLWVYDDVNMTVPEIQTAVEYALEDMFAAQPIGGDGGYLYKSKIEGTILNAVSDVYRVSVSSPAGDTTISTGYVPTKGTVTVSPAITVTAR